MPLSLLPYFRFLNERGQASIMNQLVAQFSRTSIEGTPPVVPPLPAPGPAAPRPGFPPPLLAAVAHPRHLGVPMVPGLPQPSVPARPALRPVWSRTARIPACGLRCGTAGARQSPSSGDGSLGKGI